MGLMVTGDFATLLRIFPGESGSASYLRYSSTCSKRETVGISVIQSSVLKHKAPSITSGLASFFLYPPS